MVAAMPQRGQGRRLVYYCCAPPRVPRIPVYSHYSHGSEEDEDEDEDAARDVDEEGVLNSCAEDAGSAAEEAAEEAAAPAVVVFVP